MLTFSATLRVARFILGFIWVSLKVVDPSQGLRRGHNMMPTWNAMSSIFTMGLLIPFLPTLTTNAAYIDVSGICLGLEDI